MPIRFPFVRVPLILALLLGAPASAQAPDTGDLPALRERALELVNRERRERDLEPLQLEDRLDRAAQAHAEDMLARDFFAHESPDGATVQDRYVDAGGSRWRLVAENIGRCRGCPAPPTAEDVERNHRGWMDSPGHRENILREGLSHFGFGVAVRDGDEFAVQTFSGPGRSRGLQPGEQAEALAPDEHTARAVRLINRVREREGARPLEASDALAAAARRLAPEKDVAEFELGRAGDPLEAIPSGERGRWRSVAVLAAGCGGCGAAPNRADVRAFRDQWLEDPGQRGRLLDPDLTHLGFRVAADGQGAKVAIAILGSAR
jgi:uncharacterized protein YkwD